MRKNRKLKAMMNIWKGLRWLCDERVADPAALSGFDRDGWAYDAEGSSPNKPLYVRR